MSSMESLDKLQAELSGNVYGDAFHTLYKLSQDVNVEHAELMAQAMKWVHKEKVEPLEAENAKLRELCVGLYKLADESYVPFVSVNKWVDEIVDIERRMRELGIEVPDA